MPNSQVTLKSDSDSAHANIARVNSLHDGIILDFGLGDDLPPKSKVRIAISRTVAKQLLRDLQETLQQDLYPDAETREYMERQAVSFAANREKLLSQYAGMYVIFEDGKVLDAGPDEAALVMRYCTRDEPKDMFVKKVMAKDPLLSRSECGANIGDHPIPVAARSVEICGHDRYLNYGKKKKLDSNLTWC